MGALFSMHKALRSPSSASLCSAPSSFRGKAFIVLHFIMLDQSYQRSHSAKADSRIQPRPVAADSAAGRRAGEARPKGESRKRTEESLLSSGRFRLSPATGWPGPLPVLFNRLSCHKQVLCFFLDSRKKRTPFVPLVPLVPAPLAAHPGQLHVQARKDALFQPGDVALRYPQRVGNLLLRHLPRAAQTKAKLHDLLLAQGQARQRRAQ